MLFAFDRTAPLLADVAAIDDAQVDAYHRLGFLAVARLLDPATVGDVLSGLAAVATEPRGALVEHETWAGPDHGLDGIRKLMFFTTRDARLADLAANAAIVSVLRRLLGAEPELIQDMALLKPPGGGREKPWHQDHAFFNVPLGTPVVGVWLALDDAGVHNGCMHVLPGTHREGPVIHFNRRDFQICDTDVQTHRDTAVPIPAGGALFFDGLLHHGTPPNTSSTRRRAVQLHYVPAGTPRAADEQRLAVFGADGKDATC